MTLLLPVGSSGGWLREAFSEALRPAFFPRPDRVPFSGRAPSALPWSGSSSSGSARLGFSGAGDPGFGGYLDRGASNVYLVDLLTGASQRITCRSFVQASQTRTRGASMSTSRM